VVLLTHGDSIGSLAVGFKQIAISGDIIAGLKHKYFYPDNLILINYIFAQAISNETAKIYGVQFHPEVDLTVSGKTILKNFLINIAHCAQTFTMKSREQQCLDELNLVDKQRKIVV